MKRNEKKRKIMSIGAIPLHSKTKIWSHSKVSSNIKMTFVMFLKSKRIYAQNEPFHSNWDEIGMTFVLVFKGVLTTKDP